MGNLGALLLTFLANAPSPLPKNSVESRGKSFHSAPLRAPTGPPGAL